MRKLKLLRLALFFPILLAASCKEGPADVQSDSGICYHVLDFSDLPAVQNDKLAELSLNIHDNYFIYKNLDANPIRFDNKIYMSLDCKRGVEALNLDDWMREMINAYAEIKDISEEKYNSMYEKSTSGIIIVK